MDKVAIEGRIEIEADCAALMVCDAGTKVNQFGVAELRPLNEIADEVRFEMVKVCGLKAAPGVARKTRELGVTAGGAAAPGGTMLKTIEIDTGGCMPSVGVRVTAP